MFKFIIIFITFCLGTLAFANEDEQEKNEAAYIEALALTFQAFERQNSDVIWPSFQLTSHPSVFHFKNGHVYAFGLAPYSSAWEKQSMHHFPILFCPHYPIPLAPLHPSFPLENQQVFVFSLNQSEDASFIPLLTFIHERFHIYQFQSFPKERISHPVLIDYQNRNELALMELENLLLKSFLQANSDEEKIENLKNYLAVSQLRREKLHPASRNWEDHQQKMEGLADYVSVKTFQVFSCIDYFHAETTLLDMRDKKTIGLTSLSQDAMKGRHYFVGAVLGWALDFCEFPNWKLKIEQEKVSLQTLIERALSIGEEEKQKRFAELKKSLKWEQIQKRVSHQLEREGKEIAKVTQAFEGLQGIIIEIGLPSGHMSAGGRHQKNIQIDQSKALLGDTSLSISQDQSWKLCFEAIPIVFEKQNGNRIFKLNPQTILNIDKKEISLEKLLHKSFASIQFSSIALKDRHCELQSTRSGQLLIQNQRILIAFD